MAQELCGRADPFGLTMLFFLWTVGFNPNVAYDMIFSQVINILISLHD